MDHILSQEEIERLKVNVNHVKEDCEDAVNKLNTIIDGFNSEGVVQSLYASGNFGQEQEETLIKIRNAVNQYLDIIGGEGQLVDTTNKFLNEQLERVQTGL